MCSLRRTRRRRTAASTSAGGRPGRSLPMEQKPEGCRPTSGGVSRVLASGRHAGEGRSFRGAAGLHATPRLGILAAGSLPGTDVIIPKGGLHDALYAGVPAPYWAPPAPGNRSLATKWSPASASARHAISADVLFSLLRASWPARALRLPRGATRWTSEPAAPRHCTLLAHAARHRRRCACFLARRWTSAEKTASLWGPDSAKIARAS